MDSESVQFFRATSNRVTETGAMRIQKPADSPCKDVILKALTRLNERSTIRAAADELSIIIRALDQDSLAALVQSICSTGAWEPKPVAKKECIRVLAQLPLVSCPVSDIVLQHYLPKVMGYLKKSLQDGDSLVRDASCDALAAYTQALTELYGCLLPGNMSVPVVKITFDCLSEQKKESQMAASQALLKVAPCLEPLDKDLVKLILRLLKGSAFLGTAQLLAAIASTDPDTHLPVGLLKHGAAAFLPYINHLVGQVNHQRSSASSAYESASSGGGSHAGSGGGAAGGSGILGCLSSKDWAVRRAAADAVRAAVLLLGPALEPEDNWGLGDPGSITRRCLNALEDCRFDKVKEARDAAREAVNLLQQLHRFVAEQGSDGDWPLWASSNLPYSGWPPPAQSPPHSPTFSSPNSFRHLRLQHTSPIAERFRQAAVDTDVVVEPGSKLVQFDSARAEDMAVDSETAIAAAAGAAAAAADRLQSSDTKHLNCSQDAEAATGTLATEISASTVSSNPGEEAACQLQRQQRHVPQAPPQPRRQPSRSCSTGAAAGGRAASGSRSSSSHSSRPSSSSLNSSKRISSTDQRQQPVSRQSTQQSAFAVADGEAAVLSAGGSGRAATNTARQPRLPAARGQAKAAAHQLNATGPIASGWHGPSEQEWQLVQQQLMEAQQLVQQLQQQTVVYQQQHSVTIQQLNDSHAGSVTLLQERIAALELTVQQQQQQLIVQQQQLAAAVQPLPQSASSRHASRCNSSRDTAVCGGLPQMCMQSPHTAVNTPIAITLTAGEAAEPSSGIIRHSSSSRLYRSAEWSTPPGSVSGRRPGLFALDPLASAGQLHHSFNGIPTPTSAVGGMRGCESTVATPGDLDAAYIDALRGDRGDVHLLRLIQKTGPVWSQLSARTCHDLLEVFIKHVRDGVMLHRVLPWLWRLADEDAGRPDVPWELQQLLLEALKCCPAAEDLQAQEKVSLLVDTLKAVWMAKA